MATIEELKKKREALKKKIDAIKLDSKPIEDALKKAKELQNKLKSEPD
jgi:hypothetical protein